MFALGGASIAKTLTLALLLFVVSLLGCRSTSAPTTGNTQAETSRVATAPEWRPGDRWLYRWANGTATGTRTVEVVERREVGGVSYYVVKDADAERLNYWTTDLRWAFAVGVRDSKVEARIDRPVPWFTWPLEVGRQWSHQGVYEDRSGKRQANENFMIVGNETVEVPGGRFETVKIVREGQSADSDQYWYAPDVRSYVKWILKRGDNRIEEELVEYKPAERLIPQPARTTSSPK
jgi:hypothetical protein